MSYIYVRDLLRDYSPELKEMGLVLGQEDNNTICAIPNCPVNTKLVEICCKLQKRVTQLEEMVNKA